MGGTIATRLARFALATRADELPRDLRERAALHLLDTLGCGLAAVGTGAGAHASAVAAAQGGEPQATLLGERARLPAASAALANGTRCHALDFDDTHEAGICHASTVVAPAALAVAEATGASGRELLAAYLVGTEVALRIAIASADGLYERGFHPTGVCGAFGAAAAAARLRGLGERETVNALGVVGSFASGLFEYLSDGSSTKPLHAGWAAQAGVQAALLAEAGASGPATVVEGRFGLLASHAGGTGGAEAICAGLGESWELDAVVVKPYPACHFAHSSTWAAAELAEEHGLAPGDVEAIVVRIPPEGEPLVLDPLEAKHAPRTPYDAKFSLPFTVAHRLVHGRLEVASFSDEAIRDERVLELARRVSYEPLAERAPSRFAGGARIATRDGRELDRFLAHAPGSSQNPLGEDSVLTKFRANAELALGPEAAAELADALRALDQAPTLERVVGPALSATA
jgi:2-methylcitrate dehydratase PrpD